MRLMNTLAAAVDEYLHLVARVSPWELAREEPRLVAFCEWLEESPGGAAGAELDEIDPEAALRHADEARLSGEECEALLGALAGLYRWAIRDGRTIDNPFAAAHEWARAARAKR